MNLKQEREILDMRASKLDNQTFTKIMVGLMIGPIFLGAIVFSKILLQIMILLVTTGMFIEWYNMTKSNLWYNITGLVAIAIPVSCLFAITLMFDNYMYIFLTFGVIIVATDVFAMAGGKLFAGPRLAPKISPNKTWIGLLSGMAASAAFALFISHLPEYDFVYDGRELAIFAAFLALIGQGGDLFVSFFKRKFNLKDTGSILPGHGGLLDRFDSIIFTSPIILYVSL